MVHRLNSRQRLFCQHLLQGCTLARAYQAAGYRTKPHHSAAAAFRLRSNPVVAAHLAELQQTHASALIASRDELLAFHTRVLRTSPAELDDSDPLLEITRHTVQKSDGATETRTRLRSLSKLAAAREIARLTGLHQRPAKNVIDAQAADPVAETQRLLDEAFAELALEPTLPDDRYCLSDTPPPPGDDDDY